MDHRSYAGLAEKPNCTIIRWADLEHAFAAERLMPYRRYADDDLDRAASLYLWNIALSESLYPLLHLCEITLRNSFHQALAQHFGRTDWYEDAWLDARDAAKVVEAKQKIQRLRLVMTPGRVVTELTFGFWTSLLDVRYERSRTLWPWLAPKIFANTPRKLRTRKNHSRYAAQLRTLRNRIFHHEPIWHWPNLQQIVAESQTWLAWLNPAVSEVCGLMDRFHHVFTPGPNAMPTITVA